MRNLIHAITVAELAARLYSFFATLHSDLSMAKFTRDRQSKTSNGGQLREASIFNSGSIGLFHLPLFHKLVEERAGVRRLPIRLSFMERFPRPTSRTEPMNPRWLIWLSYTPAGKWMKSKLRKN
jgi:hypothetical protein